MRKLLLTLLLAAACAPLGHAQSAPDERDKVNVFVGYSHNRVDTGAEDAGVANIVNNREGFNGVNASLTGNVSRYFGLKFDYSYHRKEFDFTQDVVCVAPPCLPITVTADAKVHNFLGGVQIKDNSKDPDKRLRPFAHLLVGAHNTSLDFTSVVCPPGTTLPCPLVVNEDETGFAAAVGGGLDVRLSDRVSVRAIQLDWNPNRFGSDAASDARTSHNFRIGVGVVFH